MPDTAEATPYVPMQIPGVGEVLLPKGTLFCPISPQLLEQLGDDWSSPVRVKVQKADDGLVDMRFMVEEPADG